MKLVLFDDHTPGALTADGVVDLSGDVPRAATGQAAIEHIISHWDTLRPTLEERVRTGRAVPVSSVRLRAPLPQPANVVGMQVNYHEGGADEGGPIRAFPLLPSALSGPGDVTTLPQIDFQECRHEAELVAVIGATTRNVSEDAALDYVFGYTAGVDIGLKVKDNMGPLAKCCDGFKPIGPCIVTKDEIPDPQDVQVRFSVDGVLRQDFSTSDMTHSVRKIVSWLSTIMTLVPGDIIFTGTNHGGVGPLQNGESCRIEIVGIGAFEFAVSDPRKRRWLKVWRNQSGPVTWQNTGGYRHRSGPIGEG